MSSQMGSPIGCKGGPIERGTRSTELRWRPVDGRPYRPAALHKPKSLAALQIKNTKYTEWDSCVLVDSGPVFGQSWARDRYQRLRLEILCINKPTLIRETDSKAGS